MKNLKTILVMMILIGSIFIDAKGQASFIEGSWHSTDTLHIPVQFDFQSEGKGTYKRGDRSIAIVDWVMSEKSEEVKLVDFTFTINGGDFLVYGLVRVKNKNEMEMAMFKEEREREGRNIPEKKFVTFKKVQL